MGMTIGWEVGSHSMNRSLFIFYKKWTKVQNKVLCILWLVGWQAQAKNMQKYTSK